MKKQFIIIILGAIFMACSTDQQNKTEHQMEPRILAIGRLQSTLDVLVEEWERYGRNVIASNSKERIKEIIETESIDFIVIGGGLPE
jgi:sensor histidine kinase regulating citrate/malate metabolism